MVGLYASHCIAIVISFVGGRPGMISAATGAMALVMVDLVKDHGLNHLLAATILTGFVNSLALLIFTAQLTHFVGESWIMYVMTAVSLAIIHLFPLLTKAPFPPRCHRIDDDRRHIHRGDGTYGWGYRAIYRSAPHIHATGRPFDIRDFGHRYSWRMCDDRAIRNQKEAGFPHLGQARSALNGVLIKIPMAALVAVMFMVSIGTFDWSSLKRN